MPVSATGKRQGSVRRALVATAACTLVAAGVMAPLLVPGGAQASSDGAHHTSAPQLPVPSQLNLASYAPGRVVVKFKPGTPTTSVRRAENAVGASELSRNTDIHAHVLSVPTGHEDAVVAALSHNRVVQYAERDALAVPTDTVPNDPYFPAGSYRGGEWGSQTTQAPRAWDMTTGSPQVILAIVDSGVASAHPDLSPQLVTGWNVLNNSTDTSDSYGHGTEVAGVAASASNNAVGVAGYCWSCRLMPVKVYNTSSGAYDSNIAAGVTWAVDHGAKVVNISLAGPGTSSTLANAVSYAQQKGAVVVAAAGNGSCSCTYYPAGYAGVVSVAGSDQWDDLYSWSNYGPSVDVAAPGQNLTTTLTDPVTGSAYGYNAVGGTSLAAPVVTGIAGLLFSTVPTASPQQVTSAIFTGVDPVQGTARIAYGRINAYKALIAIGAMASSPSPSPSPSPTASPTASPSGSAPMATAPPTMSGTAQQGQSMTASTGTWSGSPTSIAYQWGSCDAAGVTCSPIVGATAATYVAQATDVGFSLRVVVTATNTAGSGSAASTVSSVVTAAGPVTTTFSGSLTGKIHSRTFAVDVAAGTASASLRFGKCAALSLGATENTTLGSASGPSVLDLGANVTAGTVTYTVSGACRVSFTLVVTAPTP